MTCIRSAIFVMVYFILFSKNADLFGQINISKENVDTSANVPYKLLDELGQSLSTDYHLNTNSLDVRATSIAYQEYKYKMFRDFGIKLWYLYPEDIRKFQWFARSFASTGYLNNHYWLNIDSGAYKYMQNPMFTSYDTPIDWVALHRDEEVYPKLKKEYFKYLESSSNTDDIINMKRLVSEYELSSFLKLSRNLAYRKGEKLDLVKLKELFLANGETLKQIDWKNLSSTGKYLTPLFTMDNDFISNYKHYGLNVDDLKGFFQVLSDSSNPEIQRWILQKRSLLALKEEALQLKHKAIDGRMVDLKKMRGKVVLVDFWSTSCSSCIARMPAIKKIYDKYKDHGFEVVSACLNYGNEMAAIQRIEQKIGADWPVILIGGKKKEDMPNSLSSQIWEKYGFMGVPQLLLLDKNGKLVMLNDILRDGDFEPLLVSLLK